MKLLNMYNIQYSVTYNANGSAVHRDASLPWMVYAEDLEDAIKKVSAYLKSVGSKDKVQSVTIAQQNLLF